MTDDTKLTREDTAKEVAFEALASITFDQLHAVHEALAATPASDKPEGEAP